VDGGDLGVSARDVLGRDAIEVGGELGAAGIRWKPGGVGSGRNGLRRVLCGSGLEKNRSCGADAKK
jgi:hypothetical protein